MPAWTCAECENENDAARAECEACDAARPPAAAAAGGNERAGYVVGVVTSCEPVAGKDKLRQLRVDIGAAAPLAVVTSAANVAVGLRVVVATVGSTVNGEVLKRAAVGGVQSEGMLCDNAMLGWTGGGAGNAALLPESCAPGSAPPEARPRLK
jgi:tRNA-binding EMAP/Myf-like protein